MIRVGDGMERNDDGAIVCRHDGPVHGWFSLSYAPYLTLPRVLLSEMPLDWQERFVACLNELHDEYDIGAVMELEPDYTVQARKNGRFVEDPFRNYRRPDARMIDSLRNPERRLYFPAPALEAKPDAS